MNLVTPLPLRKLQIPEDNSADCQSNVFVLRDGEGEHENMLCHAYLSSWDSAHIGKNVFRLNSIRRVTRAQADHFPGFREWVDSVSGKQATLVWVKLPAEEFSAVQLLQRDGFSYVSGLISFSNYLDGNPCDSYPGTVRKLHEGERIVIEDMASYAFMKDRLYFEPGLSHDVASAMYSQWAGNCCDQLCDDVLVDVQDNLIRGFVSLKEDVSYGKALSARAIRIVLIAVREDCRGMGVGMNLLKAVEGYSRSKDSKWCLVGTSTSNIPAQRLYVRGGYIPHHSDVCLSYHGG